MITDEQRHLEFKIQTPPENVVSLRVAMSSNLASWLSLCLRGRLADFPIAFLVALLQLCSVVIFSDTMWAVKQRTGNLIWPGEAFDHVLPLRNELLPIAVDLLGVVAKGAKPLRFNCFAHAPGQERSSEGMRLMADNAASFDIMARLQSWIVRHRATLSTDIWAETRPFTPGARPSPRPIQALHRLVAMGYGNLQDG